MLIVPAMKRKKVAWDARPRLHPMPPHFSNFFYTLSIPRIE
jgi:hypothetical protein